MSLNSGPSLYFYNKNIKNLLIGFLGLFTGFKIKRWNSETGAEEQMINVPILFGEIERASYMNSEGQSVQRYIELPLIHISLESMEIDKTRTFAMKSLHAMGEGDGESIDNLLPYPYNFNLTMTIFTRYQEDTMQLVEQIVPLFNFHRVFYIKHPIFPDDITMANWANITTYPSFPFVAEYAANERRGVLGSPLNFLIEGWMVREKYEAGGIIKDIITNYNDYVTQAGLERVRLIGDPSIRDLNITRTDWSTIAVGNIIQGSHYGGIVTQVIAQNRVICKFTNENECFLKNEVLKIGSVNIGTTILCDPYDNQTLVETITAL